MKCPDCGSWTTVAETRQVSPYRTRRARVCANGHRFPTFEVLPQLVSQASKARVAAVEKEAAKRAQRAERDAAIFRAVQNGESMAAVARRLGMSYSRVTSIFYDQQASRKAS